MKQPVFQQTSKPLKTFLRYCVKILLLLLKPVGRIFGFVVEWTAKLAPFVIVGGYVTALWNADSKFLENDTNIRDMQIQINPNGVRHTLAWFPAMIGIRSELASTRAQLDRGKLIKDQFFFTMKCIGKELWHVSSNPFDYKYSDIGKKTIFVYAQILNMPIIAIRQISYDRFENDPNNLKYGQWENEFDLSGVFKQLDNADFEKTNQVVSYLNFPEKANVKTTEDNTVSFQEIKNLNHVDDTSNTTIGLFEKEKEEKCRNEALKAVDGIKKKKTYLCKGDCILDLTVQQDDEYNDCMSKKSN